MKFIYKKILIYTLIFCGCTVISCKNEPKQKTKLVEMTDVHENTVVKKSIDTGTDTKEVDTSTLDKIKSPPSPLKKKSGNANTEEWVELSENEGFLLDIRYATTNNFTKKKIYDCAKCYVRPEAAKQLLEIQKELKNKFGYSIKLFDCYRPRPYQQRLWDIVPNPQYVTPPNKGSMHSRGLAVDLTLVDKNGKELDMGTAFDFFGAEAHQGYAGHTDAVKRHRWILKSTMEKHGFGSIRTEWWHYSYKAISAPLDTWVWDCI